MTEAAESRRTSRGRVVMLVDNGVRNDSRVRKQAQSAAELGWDVFLIGKATGKRPERFRLGEAKVRLLPVENTLGKRHYEMTRGGLVRGSLAYPTRRLADYRGREAEVRLYDARLRRMRLRQDVADGGLGPRVGLALNKVALARALAESRWVEKRVAATERDATAALTDSPLGRARTTAVEKLMGERAWRVMDPHLWDFEVAYRDVIDRLQPDIIHANDVAMIGVGARAVTRARAAGRDVKLVYDAHEYVPGISRPGAHPWWQPAQIAYEREYIHDADAVITVSETLAEMLQEEHGLDERPGVVLNAPQVGEAEFPEDGPRLRELCGIDETTPLLIYSGGMAPQRGVQIMVEALPQLPGVHVGYIIANPESPFVKELMQHAAELGVRERVHLLPYVAPEHVVEYVSAADIGVHPTHHHVNHEISLATKFFEYSHARLPIVVSDVKTMGDMVRASGQGEVFRAEDLDDYLRAIRAVLTDPQRYRAAYDKPGLLEEWTWRKQAEVLDSVYERLIRP
ncbi:glycosyltransferase family 4 protein [Nocardioides pakistanensis]